MPSESAPRPPIHPEIDDLIRFLREIQIVHALLNGPAAKPDGDPQSPHASPEDTQPKRRRSRPSPLFSVRWWSAHSGYALSTLYSAIENGHLIAHQPEAA